MNNPMGKLVIAVMIGDDDEWEWPVSSDAKSVDEPCTLAEHAAEAARMGIKRKVLCKDNSVYMIASDASMAQTQGPIGGHEKGGETETASEPSLELELFNMPAKDYLTKFGCYVGDGCCREAVILTKAEAKGLILKVSRHKGIDGDSLLVSDVDSAVKRISPEETLGEIVYIWCFENWVSVPHRWKDPTSKPTSKPTREQADRIVEKIRASGTSDEVYARLMGLLAKDLEKMVSESGWYCAPEIKLFTSSALDFIRKWRP